jgi:nitrate reductase gamma subunit
MSRPFGVVFISILLFIAGIYNIIIGFALMFLKPSLSSITNEAVNVDNIPFGWLIVSGILAVILGLMYFWIARLALAGSQTAYVLINFLALLNIIFALFSLPFGWGALALNVLVLILVNTQNAKAWLSQTA